MAHKKTPSPPTPPHHPPTQNFQWQNQWTHTTQNYLAGVDEVGRGPLAGPVVAACALVRPPAGQGVLSKKEINSLLRFLLQLGVRDSKKLSSNQRSSLLQQWELPPSQLRPGCLYTIPLAALPDVPTAVASLQLGVALGAVEAADIDRINILQASLLAMELAWQECWQWHHHHHISRHLHSEKFADGQLQNHGLLLIDGHKKIQLPPSHQVQEIPLIKGDQNCPLIALASIVAKEYRDNLMVQMGELYPGYGFERHSGYPTAAHKSAIAQQGISPIHRLSFAGVKEYVLPTS